MNGPAAVLPAATTALLLLAAWRIHTRVRGFLPEDHPDPSGGGRKNHSRPIPMAGVFPALVCSVALFVDSRPWLGTALLCTAAVGLYDDRDKELGEGMGWRLKALGLLLASLLTCLHLLPGDRDLLTWSLVFVAVFCLTNALNFLDNTDGVASALGCFGLLWIGIPQFDHSLALALAGCWAVFLLWNWPRPYLFLGDQGSLPLGLLLAALTLEPWTTSSVDGGGARSFATAAAPVVVPVLDFVQVIAARLWIGHPPWRPDRRHLTHIVRNAGVPARAVAPLFFLLAAALAWLLSSLGS